MNGERNKFESSVCRVYSVVSSALLGTFRPEGSFTTVSISSGFTTTKISTLLLSFCSFDPLIQFHHHFLKVCSSTCIARSVLFNRVGDLCGKKIHWALVLELLHCGMNVLECGFKMSIDLRFETLERSQEVSLVVHNVVSTVPERSCPVDFGRGAPICVLAPTLITRNRCG
ncbi:hypothetical protein BJX68DRAFT_249150 [Aspergillus pseudodeflectus]|uniref:Uncharacterized protein n=1 Tax=Aspergillus pseudodeflectus TaxID=176178 RepID=A0ABR4JDV2_9EURO